MASLVAWVAPVRAEVGLGAGFPVHGKAEGPLVQTVGQAGGGSLTVEGISVPIGWVGCPFRARLTATGGVPPYVWSVVGLPQGLRLDPNTGEIAGTPATQEEVTLLVAVTDSLGATAEARLPLQPHCVSDPFLFDVSPTDLSLDFGPGAAQAAGNLTLIVAYLNLRPIEEARVEVAVDDESVVAVQPTTAITTIREPVVLTVTARSVGRANVRISVTDAHLGTVERLVPVRVTSAGQIESVAVIPVVSLAAGISTFIILQNPSEEPIRARVEVFDSAGEPAALVEGGGSLELAGHGNMLFPLASLLEADTQLPTGWIRLTFDRPAHAAALLLETTTFSVTAVPAVRSTEAEDDLSVVEFRARSNFTGRLFILNPFPAEATVEVILYSRDGDDVTAGSGIFTVGGVPMTGRLEVLRLGPGEMFEAQTDQLAAEGQRTGSIGIRSSSPVVAGELFQFVDAATGAPLTMVYLGAR